MLPSNVSADVVCSMTGGPLDGAEIRVVGEPPELIWHTWQASPPDQIVVPHRYDLAGVDTMTAKRADGTTETSILRARYVHVPA